MESSGGAAERGSWISRAIRTLPALAALGLTAAVFGTSGACGRSIFPTATPSTTATATVTPTPGTGEFLYVGDFGDGNISTFVRNLTTGTLPIPATTTNSGAVNGPLGLAEANGTFLYVANPADSSVHQFSVNLSSGALTSIGTIAAGTSPQWVAVSGSSFLYATNFSSASISPYTINLSTGALTANGSAVTSALMLEPYGAIATSANLYVTDQGTSAVLIFPINPTGTLAGPTSVSLGAGAAPSQVILDPTQSFLYTADANNGLLYFVNLSTLVVTDYTSSTTSGSAGLAITTTSSGFEFLYVANLVGGTITGFAVAADGTLTSLGQTLGLGVATGIVIDPTGSFLYVTNANTGVISLFSIDPIAGTLTFVQNVPAEGSGSSSPASVPNFMALVN